MTRRKDPAAVSLGRKGGRTTTPTKATAVRRNGSQWGPRMIAAWMLAMKRAAEMVRKGEELGKLVYAPNEREANTLIEELAARIEAEPWPRGDQ